MASYLLTGFSAQDMAAFRARCEAAGVSPRETLRAFLQYATPKYDAQTDSTKVVCAITFHHRHEIIKGTQATV